METLKVIIDKDNIEQQKAFELVANTNTSLFITGKAGTGKTTFIKRIQEEIDKNFIVLAPTGIAAIAVGGQTMHSFFGFPIQTIGPFTKLEVSPNKKKLLEEVDTIIVDEVSMVRCDMVDGMDRFLRKAFNTNMAFGGKQVVFVGDLFQLPPVIKQGSPDEEMLRDLYGPGLPFFYKAAVLKRMNLPKIEFQKVYRQKDKAFLTILDKMRNGNVNTEDLAILNEHVGKEENSEEFSVTLTSFNTMAEKINDQKLNNINEEEFIYQAEIHEDFKKSDAPVPEFLRLKVGAQVIFCRNNPNSGYVNGTIAKISLLEEDKIVAKLENGNEIEVYKSIWENTQCVYNRKTRKMESKTIGSFIQYPIKLAWAITIHKSQGMTFDRMHFDLSRGTFMDGQAYVAISRIRSLDGLTLSHPIMSYHIRQNPEAKAFSNSYNNLSMIDDELKIGKMLYKYISEKKYDMAAKECLKLVIAKAKKNELRNAALIAKMMFDIMLDDRHLMGLTGNVKLLKDCTMTCNFLNALFCLYGGKYEEAIGYADAVLSRKNCVEAMFIKSRALYEIGRYDEAHEVNCQIIEITNNKEDMKVIDKKLLLFQARVNEQIGCSNISVCKKLVEICPECLEAYYLLRKDMIKNNQTLEVQEDEDNSSFILAFNDTTVSEAKFRKILSINNIMDKDYSKLRRRISNIVA